MAEHSKFKPDWSIAPEGTTHYDPRDYGDDKQWVKLGDNNQWWSFHGHDIGWITWNPYDVMIENLIERPIGETTNDTSFSDDWSDRHYSFDYAIQPEDIEKGSIRIDPYFVNKQWGLSHKDDTGVLFHNLKTIARFGEKNEIGREIKALHGQIKRLAQLNGIKLED